MQAGQALCLLANHQRLFVEGRAFKSEAGALASAAEKKVPVKVEFADETPGEWPVLEPLVMWRKPSWEIRPLRRRFTKKRRAILAFRDHLGGAEALRARAAGPSSPDAPLAIRARSAKPVKFL